MSDTTELLEVPRVDAVLDTAREVILLEGESTADIVEVPTTHVLLEPTDDNQLIEVIETIVLLEKSVQGPPGPPGSGGGGTPGKALLSDYSNPTYAYLGYHSRISRVDYSGPAPVVKSAGVSDLATSWSLRTGLTYT